MQNQTPPKPRSLLSRILMGIGLLTVLCCGVTAIVALTSPRASAPAQPAAQKPAQSVAVTVQIVDRAAESSQAENATAAQPAPAPTEPPQPTATPIPPTAVPAGSSRENPVPIGAPFTAKEFSIVVNQVVRPADRIVAEGNRYNTEPEAGEEYVKVVVSITCNADPKDKCNVSPANFAMYGSQGIVRDAEWMIAGVDGALESTELFGGATLGDKALFFLVGADETNVVMEFEAGLIFRECAYFAIPDEATGQ